MCQQGQQPQPKPKPQTLPPLTPPICTVGWITKTEQKNPKKLFRNAKNHPKSPKLKPSSTYPSLAIRSLIRGPKSIGKRGFQEGGHTNDIVTNILDRPIQWKGWPKQRKYLASMRLTNNHTNTCRIILYQIKDTC